VAYRLQEAAAEEGWGSPPRRRVGARVPPRRDHGRGAGGWPAGAASQGGTPRRGGLPHRGRRCASWTGRATASGTAMRVGDGELHASRGGAACRGGAAREKRAASGTGAARKGDGDDDGGRTARFGGKRLSALEGDGAHIEPHLLSRFVLQTVTKGTFSPGSPETKAPPPLCHGWVAS
jgi:hypothetical protein